MTEQELKTKIVEVLDENENEWLEVNEPLGGYGEPYIEIHRDKLAEVFIAAGFTFDGEYKKLYEEEKVTNQSLRGTSWQFKGWYEEQKRRAEVAEKELLVYKEVVGAMLCEIDCFNEGYCPEFYKDPECENCIKKKIYGNSAATFPCLLDKYIQQAEKELQEEKKSD